MSMFASQWFASTGASAYLLEQSLLGDGTSSYLNRTPSVAGNRKTWTWSCWFKGTPVSSSFLAVEANDANGPQMDIAFQGGANTNEFEVYGYSSSYDFRLLTSSLYRDSSAWYHIVVAMDTTQATASNRTKIYINGTQVTSFGTADYPTLNYDTGINALKEHFVMKGPGAGGYVNGAVALPILVDGAALAPTAFGETDDDGFWNPIEYTGVETPASAAITYALTDSGVSGSAAVTNTYSTKSIGAADAGRTVIVGVSSNGTNIVTGMTIGGVSATELTVFTGTNNTSSVWAAAVPSGTTADIVITNAGGGAATGIAVYRALNVGSLTAYTAGSSAVADPMTATVFAPAGSAIFAAGGGYSPASFTWTGVTEDTDLGAVASGEDKATHGSIAIATDQSVDVGCDPSSGMSEGSMAAVVLTGTSFVAGGFGTNGFQLDFADTTFYGKDIASTRSDLTATFEASYTNNTTLATYTFSSCDLGAGTTNKRVIVGTSGAGNVGNEVIQSVTIDGITATEVIQNDSAGGGRPAGLYYADTNSTTGDIVVTFDTSCTEAGIGVWSTTADATPFDTGSSTANPGVATIEGPEDGFTIGYYLSATGGTGFAWTNLTEDFDEVQRASFQRHTGAHKNYATYTSESISVTSTGGSQFNLVAASFAPANDYLSNNFTASDQLEDTPTDSSDDGIGNFATWNPNYITSNLKSATLSEGNLNVIGDAQDFGFPATIGVSSGKWYWEVTNLFSAAYNSGFVGIVSGTAVDAGGTVDGSVAQFNGYAGQVYYYVAVNGQKVSQTSSSTSYGNVITNGDIVGIAFDAENGNLFFSKNGTWQNSATVGEIEAGTATNAAFSSISASEIWYPATHIADTSSINWCIANFGQKAFTYTPPTGFSALATQNLPAPTIADGSQYFNTVLYTGTGSELAITSLDFTPDFVWIKNRDATDNHMLYDSVRGATKDLHSNTADAETTTAQTLKSFDAAGFTLGTDVQVNTSAEDYVAWCWKAGGAAASNTDGTITSSVSANTTSGFSIVSYTGSGTASDTVGHGLSTIPSLIIARNRTESGSWCVTHESLSADKVLRFEGTNAEGDIADGELDSPPNNSSTFGFNNGSSGTPLKAVNASSIPYIAYCWSEVEGFSKFGSYTGNGNADGPFVYTGFRPAFILIKHTNGADNWIILDTARDTYNVAGKFLLPNTTGVEGSGSILDVVSNGFKFRAVSSSYNGSGGEYIYAAYAEHPFQGDDGVTQARAR